MFADDFDSPWGSMPSVPLCLPQEDIESLARLPRPLQLEGPKIYQPKAKADADNEARPQLKSSMLKDIVQLRYGGAVKSEAAVPASSRASSSGREANCALRRSTAEVCAAVGFQQSTENALQILTDVAAEYLRNLCRKLAAERESELLNCSGNGFPDIVERVFVECGIPSVLALQTYVMQDVVKVRNSLVKDASAWANSKEQFFDENGSTPIFLINTTSEDIPEIHFPSSEEGEMSLEHSTPQLETGMQMLQSLEQGVASATDQHDISAESPQFKRRRIVDE
jgi:hypothetical protein